MVYAREDVCTNGLVDVLDVDEVAGRGIGLARAADLELVIGAEPPHRGLARVAVRARGEFVGVSPSEIGTNCAPKHYHCWYRISEW